MFFLNGRSLYGPSRQYLERFWIVPWPALLIYNPWSHSRSPVQLDLYTRCNLKGRQSSVRLAYVWMPECLGVMTKLVFV